MIEQLLAVFSQSSPLFKAIVSFIIVLVIARAVYFVVEKIISKLAGKTKTDIDDKILASMKKPVYLIIVLLGLQTSIGFVDIGYATEIANLVESLIAIAGGFITIALVDIFIDSWAKNWAARTESESDDHLIALFHKIAKGLIAVFILLYILGVWGIEITPLLAGLGVGGLVIGLALKDSLANLFGGISLILDKTIKVGDVISVGNTKGTVMDVGVRSTRINTFDNQVVIVPSGQLANQEITNYAQPDPTIRADIAFGVAYGSDIARVKKVVMEEITNMEEVLKDPEPFIRFKEMGDSALKFKVFYWVGNRGDYFESMDKANTKIYNRLNKEGIGIPFPQMDVHLDKSE